MAFGSRQSLPVPTIFQTPQQEKEYRARSRENLRTQRQSNQLYRLNPSNWAPWGAEGARQLPGYDANNNPLPQGLPPGAVTAGMVNFERDPYSGLTLHSDWTDYFAGGGYNDGARHDALLHPLGPGAPVTKAPMTEEQFKTYNPAGYASGLWRPGGASSAPPMAQAPVKANPWFSNPWSVAPQKEVPYYMRGFNYGRG